MTASCRARGAQLRLHPTSQQFSHVLSWSWSYIWDEEHHRDQGVPLANIQLQVLIHPSYAGVWQINSVDEGEGVDQAESRKKTDVDLADEALDFW